MTDPARIQAALTSIPGPVAALTVAKGSERNGMTVSWFAPVSKDPPLLMVAVRNDRYTRKLIEEARHFVVNLFAEDQGNRVGAFKLTGPDRERKFDGLDVGKDDWGQPFVRDSAAVLHCRLERTVSDGDHTMFVGRVLDATARDVAPMTTRSLGKGYAGVT